LPVWLAAIAAPAWRRPARANRAGGQAGRRPKMSFYILNRARKRSVRAQREGALGLGVSKVLPSGRNAALKCPRCRRFASDRQQIAPAPRKRRCRCHPRSDKSISCSGCLLDWRGKFSRARQNPTREKTMRRFVLTLASVICGLFATGCDKCGAPVKFNVPSLPNACYDSTRQK
jgi:hypothetical protein